MQPAEIVTTTFSIWCCVADEEEGDSDAPRKAEPSLPLELQAEAAAASDPSDLSDPSDPCRVHTTLSPAKSSRGGQKRWTSPLTRCERSERKIKGSSVAAESRAWAICSPWPHTVALSQASTPSLHTNARSKMPNKGRNSEVLATEAKTHSRTAGAACPARKRRLTTWSSPSLPDHAGRHATTRPHAKNSAGPSVAQ